MARILVIDDDNLVCEVVGRTLLCAGHEVRQAGDGVTGLSVLREAPVDVVVTNLAMPRMTGFELISTLRTGGVRVPIIVISGSFVVSDLELIRQAQSHLSVQLLGKPFSDDQLLKAVSAALAIASL
jgi:two-component system chemotaxis response regulator CheY